jgi:hypothetical protein
MKRKAGVTGAELWALRELRDRSRDVELRSTAGGGQGLQLLDSKRPSLSVQGGLDDVAIERVTGVDEDCHSVGWGVNFCY